MGVYMSMTLCLQMQGIATGHSVLYSGYRRRRERYIPFFVCFPVRLMSSSINHSQVVLALG